MHDNDQVMKDEIGVMPVPEFSEPAFTVPPDLQKARVAIVTSAALNRTGAVSQWTGDDYHFETIPNEARDLELGHLSPNFDRAGFHADINVVFPVDRLQELEEQGVIGGVANHHYAFAGNQHSDTLSELRLDSGPACAQKMLEDDVQIVLLTPV